MSCGLQIIVPDASGDSKVWTFPVVPRLLLLMLLVTQSVDILMGCYTPDDGPLILVFPMIRDPDEVDDDLQVCSRFCFCCDDSLLCAGDRCVCLIQIQLL